MGVSQSIQKLNFEDIQYAIKNPNNYLLVNTLPLNQQKCLIIETLNAEQEEHIINKCLKEKPNINIIIYGCNSNDDNIEKKYKQLVSLGFYNVYIYNGGLFEWLLLQDIYGYELFPTTNKELDLLLYKPKPLLNLKLLEY
jgi:uncharacterized protein YlaI